MTDLHRRTFIAGAVGIFAPLDAADAQSAIKVPRIGYLHLFSGSDPWAQRGAEAFRQGLRQLGYVEGQTIAIEYRWAEMKSERLDDLADELARLKVKVLVAGGIQAAHASKHATQTIPIVMVGVYDPITSGLVATLARPGGNITGTSNMATDLLGKQLAFLKEVVPAVSRVAVLWNPLNPGHAPQLREAETAARELRVRLQPLAVRDPGDIDGAFEAMTRDRAGALLVLSDAMLPAHAKKIAGLAAKHRLAAVYGHVRHAEAGGLIVYAVNVFDQYRRSAIYVDKILKGARPAELPIEQPTTFELIVNMRAAKAIGLTIPREMLLRADQIIE